MKKKTIKQRYYVVVPIDVRASDEKYAKKCLKEFLRWLPKRTTSYFFDGKTVRLKTLAPSKPVPSIHNEEYRA